MASHHHPHHHHCQSPNSIPNNTTTVTTATYGCSCCYDTQTHYPSSPPPAPQLTIDPLLQALASLLLQQQQQQQQPSLCSHCLNQPHTYKNHHQKLNFQPQNLHFQRQDHDQQTHFVLSSLLQRINTLEASLKYLYSSSSSSFNHYHHPSYSLRDAAARVIQAHFRAFLVRRSRTLRQLKELAFVKSSFNSLKSSVSNKTHFNFEVVSRKAMDLLLKLDYIQGGDPMIRDGKRSISSHLVRFLDFMDGFAVKRHGILYKSAKNVGFVGDSNKSRSLNANNGYGDLSVNQKEVVENLRDRVEKIGRFSRVCKNDEEDVELEGFEQFIDEDGDERTPKVFINGKHGVSKIRNGVLVKGQGFQPRVKKTVSFNQDGNVYRVFGNNHESVLNGDGSFTDGSDSSYDHVEAIKELLNEVKDRKGILKGTENDEEGHPENDGSAESSDGERNPGRILRNGMYCQNQDGTSVFSAPVPLKMEPRANLMKKSKSVKIVT